MTSVNYQFPASPHSILSPDIRWMADASQGNLLVSSQARAADYTAIVLQAGHAEGSHNITKIDVLTFEFELGLFPSVQKEESKKDAKGREKVVVTKAIALSPTPTPMDGFIRICSA